MRLLYLLLTIFTSLALAVNLCHGDKSIPGHCTILSMHDTTSNSTKSTVPQCEDTCWYISMDPGEWVVDFTGQSAEYVDKLSQGKCNFFISRGEGEPLDYKFYMENQDIFDIIDEVNLKFGGLHGGKVAGEGTMMCDGHLAKWHVS
ncbi:hypothetical protein CC80DRAFT_487929 [Byssothecium circinans]|uniref:Ecp2 effector protein-like domain-containing protein n=1 Tax=Byssothecium circinans TaxID=147558 RepID=A0A6A5UC50_9PLEO|nr:hypothetical protein CC80DRAFT_487929 [Byssothecium circinans]